jgi:multimeric flavodoxin WrbA
MANDKFNKTLKYLEKKEKVLFLLTSNRWSGHKEDTPKSSSLAYLLQEKLGPNKVTIIDISKLKIYECEGNVSSKTGNYCGVKKALLKNGKDKTGELRCWASFNNKDDELYKVVNELLKSDAVVFFGSIRWGKMNAVYAKLVERLTWLENRHTTLGESNILKDIDCGVISVGHNWNGEMAIKTERQVLEFFGFKTPKELFWSYQWTENSTDETQSGYKLDLTDFNKIFFKSINEGIITFKRFLRITNEKSNGSY